MESSRFGSREDQLFVEFAAEVDDGEAECCAVAVNRGLKVLTDDKAAIKLMQHRGFGDLVVTTPEALKAWIEFADLDEHHSKEAIRQVEQCGNYSPSKKHHLYEWWRSLR